MALPRARRHPAPARAGAPAALRNRCERRPPVSWVPPGPSGHRRRGPLAALAAAVLLAGAACSTTGTTEAGDGARATTTATSPATTTRPGATAPPSTIATTAAPAATDDEAAVLAAYQGFIDTWFQANDPPNPNYPGIDTYLAGEAKTLLVEETTKNQRLGVVIRKPPDSVTGIGDHRIAVSGDSATIDACVVDDGQVVHAADGLVLNSRTVTRRQVGTLAFNAQGWRVVHNEFRSESEGLTTCGV